MTCIGERLRFPYPEGRDLINGRTGVAEINSLRKNMTCIGERLRFPYPEGRDLINGRTGVAEINSLGEKYDMYGNALDFRMRRGGPKNLEHRSG